MNQLEQNFDYSLVDPQTADFLKQKELKMSDIIGKAYTDIGKELKEAQEQLSKNRYGCFEEWYTSLGFKRDQVYRWIGRYELIVANCDKREVIEEMPVSMTYEMSKKTAHPEAIQAALNGDVRTLKEFKELERQLKEKDELLESSQAAAQHWEQVAKRAQNMPPRIETKTIEVIPEHVKRDLQDKEFQITNLRAGYQEAKAKLAEYEMRKPDDFDPEEAQRLREKLQHEADMNTINLRINFKTFIEKAAITSFLHGAIATASDSEKERLAELVESAQQIIDQTKLALRGRRLGVVNE